MLERVIDSEKCGQAICVVLHGIGMASVQVYRYQSLNLKAMSCLIFMSSFCSEIS